MIRSVPLTPYDNALTAPVTPGNRMAVVDKTKVNPETLKAAQGMEAMFIDYMMKVMRETVPKQDMDLESPATAIYRGMQDSEFAQRAAKAGGIGLADQIVAYLESQRYTLQKMQASAGPPRPREEQGVPARNGVKTGYSAGNAKAVQGVNHEGQPVHGE